MQTKHLNTKVKLDGIACSNSFIHSFILSSFPIALKSASPAHLHSL